MTGLAFARLGDVAQYLRGINFKPDDVVPVGTPGTVACMRTKNIQESLDCRDVWGVAEGFVRRPEQILKEGDILVSSANSWNLVGKCCWIPALPWKSSFGGFVSALRADPAQLDPRFLYWWFSSDRTQALLRSFGQKTTNISNLSAERCMNLRVPLPTLPEQRRIAAILDQTDILRAKRREALSQLDSLTQSIFIEMFGDPVSNPFDWPEVEFPSVIYFQEGPGVRNWQFRDSGIKLLNVGNIVNGRLSLANTSRHLDPIEVEKKYRHFLLDAGDLVVASSGVTWGKIAEVGYDHLPLCLNTSVIRLRPLDAKIERLYLRAFIESMDFRKQIARLITGSAQPNFGPSHLKQVRLMLPGIELQREYASRIESVYALREKGEASLSALETLFVALQHRAFRGEL